MFCFSLRRPCRVSSRHKRRACTVLPSATGTMTPPRVETPEDRAQASLERVLREPRGVSRGGSRPQPEPESEPEPEPEPDQTFADLVAEPAPVPEDLDVGMATALSMDWWDAPASANLGDADPRRAVNYLCRHPGKPEGAAVSSEVPGSMKGDAARWQEIFADLVAHLTTVADGASRHVLDARFDSYLPAGERAFKPRPRRRKRKKKT